MVKGKSRGGVEERGYVIDNSEEVWARHPHPIIFDELEKQPMLNFTAVKAVRLTDEDGKLVEEEGAFSPRQYSPLSPLTLPCISAIIFSQ